MLTTITSITITTAIATTAVNATTSEAGWYGLPEAWLRPP